jgi:hypothetical protein
MSGVKLLTKHEVTITYPPAERFPVPLDFGSFVVAKVRLEYWRFDGGAWQLHRAEATGEMRTVEGSIDGYGTVNYKINDKPERIAALITEHRPA